jgi:hypothetical protein
MTSEIFNESGHLNVNLRYFISGYLFKLDESLLAWIYVQFNPNVRTE